MIVVIPQLICCFISTIMDQAAIPQGQPGRNGHARARCESRERLVNRIARIPQPEAGWDRTSPQWAFLSRFMFILAYAFLVTYQAYYLLDKIGSARADVPQQIFLGTLTNSVVVIAASLIFGKLSDRTGRRKIFVFTASIVYGVAMFVIAIASTFNGFLVGMAIGGLGFGMYIAVDFALVVDVLPDQDRVAKDLGVLNVASALPFSLAPAIAPAILAIGTGYGALYAVAGVCAVIGAFAILRVRGVG